MRYIGLIILIFCLISTQKSISQTQSLSVYPHAIIIDNPLSNGNIVIGRNTLARINGTLSFAIFGSKNFQYCETQIAIIDGNTTLVTQKGPTFNRQGDFYNNGEVSNAKDFVIDIPADIVNKFTSIGMGTQQRLVVRYRYRVHGDATWLPVPEQNIGEYFTSDVSYPFKFRVIPATFLGPDIICNQNEYEIINPGDVIKLQNATNIATLTQLGFTNTYRIERIGSATGKITLTSETRGEISRKEIIVGTPPPKITGSATVVAGNTYHYAIEKSDPNATLSIDPVVSPGGAPYQISLSGNQITLTTGSLPSNANDYLIRIRATETGECGSATSTLNVRFRGGEGPIH